MQSISIATPEKLIFNQAITKFTSINISWTPPSDSISAVVEYVVLFVHGGMGRTDYITDQMYLLQNLIPSTRVDFFVSVAFSICSVLGQPSNATEFTDDIRK